LVTLGVAVQQSRPVTNAHGRAVPVVEARRALLGFWAVAFALVIVMASATLPSPLYGLYRVRDHLSAFMITVIYAIFAGGTIAALLSVRFVVARAGRRGAMLAAVATMMAAAGLLAAWKALPGLLTGRFITGVAVGLAAGTAFTYLIEPRVLAKPGASPGCPGCSSRRRFIIPHMRCLARRCSWCSPRAWQLSWRRADCLRRAYSRSARSRCSSVWDCS
jgi:hypothetical protein